MDIIYIKIQSLNNTIKLLLFLFKIKRKHKCVAILYNNLINLVYIYYIVDS